MFHLIFLLFTGWQPEPNKQKGENVWLIWKSDHAEEALRSYFSGIMQYIIQFLEKSVVSLAMGNNAYTMQ